MTYQLCILLFPVSVSIALHNGRSYVHVNVLFSMWHQAVYVEFVLLGMCLLFVQLRSFFISLCILNLFKTVHFPPPLFCLFSGLCLCYSSLHKFYSQLTCPYILVNKAGQILTFESWVFAFRFPFPVYWSCFWTCNHSDWCPLVVGPRTMKSGVSWQIL